MIVALASLIVAVSVFGTLYPRPQDKEGWGLRLHNLTVRGPYLAGERIDRVGFDITLLNYSKETRQHDPLIVALSMGDLSVAIVQPEGKPIRSLAHPSGRRDPFAVAAKMQPGECASLDFTFGDFGYYEVRKVGKHQLAVELRVGGKRIVAPPVTMDVVDVSPDAILASHAVPLEGRERQQPPNEQARPMVQQVKLGKRTFLIYRRYTGTKWGAVVEATFRLVELPGKVEMTVEGAYGAGNPLTIKYRDVNAKTDWSTLVINSIDGMPWTDEEERLQIERSKPQPPPSRPIKP